MKKLFVLPLIFFSLIEAFDQNIPELVDNTSPAVVNITSKREVTYSNQDYFCLLYTSPSPRDISGSRMPSSA